MMYSQGDILLVPIPFTDLTSVKKRPVVVISKDTYNSQTEDIIVAAVTSNIRGIKYEEIFDNEDMSEGKIPTISCIRTDKIYTLSKEIILKKYGKISSGKIEKIVIKICDLF